jgi:hypothetical protein
MHGLRNTAKNTLLIALFLCQTGALAATIKIPPHAPAKDTGSNIKSVKDLNWLVGNWTAKGAKGSVSIKANLVGDQFIYLTFDEKNATSELQVIGYSPKVKTLISWSYDDDGGFGKSIWKQEGNDLLIKSIAGHPSGKKGMAKYHLHKIDDNSFSWKSTGRMFDGKRLPDTSEVIVVRAQEK